MEEVSTAEEVLITELPPALTPDQVRGVFDAYGTVTSCRVLPQSSGYSSAGKTAAVVGFTSQEEAEWVIENLNGNIAEGLADPVLCCWASGAPASAAAPQEVAEEAAPSAAEPQKAQAPAVPLVPTVPPVPAAPSHQPTPPQRPPPPGGDGDAKDAAAAPGKASDNVFVGDLPAGISTDEVNKIFGAYGSVAQCRALPPKWPNVKASALVRFGSVEEAEWVVENLNGNLAEGLDEPLVVRFANNTKGEGKGGKGEKGYEKGGYEKGYDKGAKGGKGWAKSSDAEWWGKDRQAGPYSMNKPPSTAGTPPWANGYYYSRGQGDSPTSGGAASATTPTPPAAGKGGVKGGPAFLRPAAVPGSIQALITSVRKANLVGERLTPPDCQLFVKGLPPDTTDADMFRLFCAFGPMASSGAKAMLNPDGSCKGYGFIDYLEVRGATAAMEALGKFTTPDGVTALQVSLKTPAPIKQ